MKFIAPEFLYALGFLAIPILIHLFNFRRYKTIQFSQVRFLKSIKKQTQSTSKLKHFIVLACRCLAIAALVFAFAQPYFPENTTATSGEKKGVVVFIDNSYSMQAIADVGSLLDDAKNKALAIAESFSEADKFQLHTNNFDGNEQRWLNKEAFVAKLQELDFSPSYRNFEAIHNRLSSVENDEQLALQKFLIADLQKGSYTINKFLDSSNYYVLPVNSQLNENVWINSFEAFQPFHLPLLSEKFKLAIQKNTGSKKDKINGKLLLNGQLKNPFIVTLPEDSTIQDINFTNTEADQILGKVAIKDYPVIFDDTFYFAYPLNRKVKVLHLFESKKNNSIASLFQNDSLLEFNSNPIQQIDFSELKKSNLVLLENVTQLSSGLVSELTEFVNQGGNLLLLPSSNLKTELVNPFLNQFGIKGYQKLRKDTLKVNEINTNSSVFENVFEEKPKNINYPTSFTSWKIGTSQNVISETLFAFSDGSPFLQKIEANGGAIFLCATNVEAENGNFGRHALFVPTLYNIALQSAKINASSYLLDDVKVILQGISPSESPLKMKKGSYEWIPKQITRNNQVEILLRNQIKEPGFYSIIQGEEIIETLAFNYNRNESDLAVLTPAAFKAQAEQNGIQIQLIEDNLDVLSKSLNDLNNQSGLWKVFIILALLFIGLEILFLRILKS